MATLKINGETVTVDVEDDTPLLWVIREQVGLTGTKYGCGIAQCGTCTIHVDGSPVRSCVYPVGALSGEEEITTIEGLSEGASHPVQKAWAELDIPQCGYCQPGMIMAVAGMLNDNPNPTDEDIDAEITNICRCGTLARVRKGIKLAVEKS
ncbi:MAG: (2Fe-2S)-binding protein [Henriciella sp.]|jgi:isoquinoline 1-oxidoreductase alpha subunit|mmetsp:Transcript_28546/g.36782  ORF Transcript_28546/g.36782 Transcript_28546/m.36782 type:complete len:151 (-) Transcript_28546:28-480(-)